MDQKEDQRKQSLGWWQMLLRFEVGYSTEKFTLFVENLKLSEARLKTAQAFFSYLSEKKQQTVILDTIENESSSHKGYQNL